MHIHISWFVRYINITSLFGFWVQVLSKLLLVCLGYCHFYPDVPIWIKSYCFSLIIKPASNLIRAFSHHTVIYFHVANEDKIVTCWVNLFFQSNNNISGMEPKPWHLLLAKVQARCSMYDVIQVAGMYWSKCPHFHLFGCPC